MTAGARASALGGLAVLLGALLLPGVAAATTLAVTTFDTNTTDARLEPLGRGIAAMLTTDLSPLESLQVVERERINELLAEVEFQQSAYVDKATAVQLGKGLGAEWVLTGNVSTFAETLRMDARLVEVASGKVLETQSVTGPTEEFFLLEKELASAVLDKLEVRISARESARMGRVATESFDAFVSWSQGLEALDRGAMEDARKALEEALGHDDRFGLATSMLEDLRERLKKLDAKRAAASDAQTKAVLARLAELKAAGGPYDVLQTELVPISAVGAQPTNARAVSTIAAAVMDLGLPEELRLGGPQGVYSINEWALYSYAMAQQWLGRRSDYLTYGNAFLDRYPNSVMAAAFTAGLQNLLAMMEEEEQGRPLIAKTRVEAMGQAQRTRCVSEPHPTERLAACRAWFADSDAAGITLDGDSEEMWARAAERAGDVAEIERVLARSKAREPYGEAAEDIAGMLKRARKDQADVAKAKEKLAEADKPYEVVRAARDLADAGRFDEAFAALRQGEERLGDDDDIFAYTIRLAADVGRRDLAEATLARWEAAADASDAVTVDASAARQVLQWDENQRYVGEADAMALLQLAVGMVRIGRSKEAADAYVELATKYPDFSAMDGPSALSSAGNMYYRAWEMEAARAAYQRILDDFPEHDAARSAQQMMTLLPE